MAILHLDGCDTYTAVADIGARYAGSNTAGMSISTTGGRFGGGAIAPGNQAGAPYLGPVIIPHSGSSAIIAGGAVYPYGGAQQPILAFYNSTGTTAELTIWYVPSEGVFKLYRGYQTTLIATATVGHTPTLWHHLEAKATIADSGGTCEVRVNGATIINFSGDTRNSTTGTAGIDRIQFYSYGGSGISQGAWDDLYVLDTSGSVANNFLGDVRINTLAPTSDSAVQFTRSTGASNYLCVDEGRQNSDTDYVESATVGHIDKYGFADLAAGVATVYGVQAITWCKKTDATTRTMRNKLYSGATTTDGSSFALLTTYAPMVTTTTTDPNTSAQWTVSNANAALAGFEVLS